MPDVLLADVAYSELAQLGKVLELFPSGLPTSTTDTDDTNSVQGRQIPHASRRNSTTGTDVLQLG